MVRFHVLFRNGRFGLGPAGPYRIRGSFRLVLPWFVVPGHNRHFSLALVPEKRSA